MALQDVVDRVEMAVGDSREHHVVLLLVGHPEQQLGHDLVGAAEIEQAHRGEVELGGAMARARDGPLDPVAEARRRWTG